MGRLGNQAGIANCYHQLGMLRTTQKRLLEAVPLHLQALATRLAMGVPQARDDARALASLRTALGPQHFTELGHAAFGDEGGLAELGRLLDQYDLRSTDNGSSRHTDREKG